MSAPRFDALVAVGDNLLLDTNSVGPHNGAASLFYRNRDAAWPDFKGRDMVTRDPAVRLLVLAQSGANARSTLAQQMKRVPLVDDPVLAVITVGSRDLLARTGAFAGANNGREPSVDDADTFYDVLTGIFEELERRLSDAHILVANIPDAFGGHPEAAALLAEFNSMVADVAREQGAGLVDLHGHFQGHGPDEGEEAWLTPDLDPTPLGASEIRRAFLQALLAM